MNGAAEWVRGESARDARIKGGWFVVGVREVTTDGPGGEYYYLMAKGDYPLLGAEDVPDSAPGGRLPVSPSRRRMVLAWRG